MTISSFDSIISSISNGKSRKAIFQKASSNGATSAAGRFHELFTATGIPSAGAFSGTAGVATAMNASTTGALSIPSTVSPDVMHLLNINAFSPTATGVPSRLILCDFLLYYPACVVTGTPTTLNNTATLPRYTDGQGVQAVIAVQSALGAASPALTLSYTDQSGNTGNSAAAHTSPVNSAPISTLFQTSGAPFLQMVGADSGIRKIDSYTLASGTTGTVAFILVKPLAEIPLAVVNTTVGQNMLAEIPSLPKIEDGACLGFIMLTGAAMVAACSFQGSAEFVWG
jgi:hypothetical protein